MCHESPPWNVKNEGDFFSTLRADGSELRNFMHYLRHGSAELELNLPFQNPGSTTDSYTLSEHESTEREFQSTWNFWDSNPEFYIVRYSWYCKLLGPQRKISYVQQHCVEVSAKFQMTLTLSLTALLIITNGPAVSSGTSLQVQEMFAYYNSRF